jgi:hypothetical protein
MTEPTLKPCPFCGNDEIKVDLTAGGMKAWCINCAAEGPMTYFSADGTAQGAWNDSRCGEENAVEASHLAMLLDLEQTLDAAMARVGRLKAEDRHEVFIEGLQCADGVVRAWIAKQRAALERA